jgi:hypothetical protein
MIIFRHVQKHCKWYDNIQTCTGALQIFRHVQEHCKWYGYLHAIDALCCHISSGIARHANWYVYFDIRRSLSSPSFPEVGSNFFSENSVNIYQSIRRNTEEDPTVYQNRHKKLKPSISVVSYILIS